MAEDKKIFGGDSDRKTTERIVFLLAGLFLLAAVITALLNLINKLEFGISGILDYFTFSIWPVWKLIALIVSVLALVGIIYNSWKLRAINIEERKIFNIPPAASALDEEETVGPQNKKMNSE